MPSSRSADAAAAALRASVEVHPAIADVGASSWDACVPGPERNPFVRYDFLKALEESGCVGPRTGWTPCHLSVRDEGGAVAGVMPLYLKSHSQGEYVFDHGWAEAYARAGGEYYPKLQAAIPFTPVTGPRLLSREAAPRSLLARGAAAFCDQVGASSVHVTFPSETDWSGLGAHGFLQRQDQQYWWRNAGYGSFDDFLGALSSGRRKTIRRERREAQAGLEIIALTGSDLTEAHWDAFYGFYMDTGARKWGRPYLNRRFFSLIGERMADEVLLVMARRGGRWIAGALNFIGSHALYGRNWGAVEDVPFLHFELCYYQAIEHAIARGLDRVEAGAQGEHKIARGYLPSPVYSAHYIADPALRAPVARYLAEERAHVEHDMRVLETEYSPFKA